MSRRVRTFDEIATDFYIHNATEVQRFTGLSYQTSKSMFKLAYDLDKERLGDYMTTNYVRRKTVMKLAGITDQDVIEKLKCGQPTKPNRT